MVTFIYLPRFSERCRGDSCILPICLAQSEQMTIRIQMRHGNISMPLFLPTLQRPDRQTSPLAGSMLPLCGVDPLRPPSVPSSGECAVEPSLRNNHAVASV